MTEVKRNILLLDQILEDFDCVLMDLLLNAVSSEEVERADEYFTKYQTLKLQITILSSDSNSNSGNFNGCIKK